MAIFHFNMGHVSRSTGRSCVQSVAYVTRSKIYEERRGITADYRNAGDVEFWETLAPEGSGIAKDDLSIWNRFENFEDEYGDKRYLSEETKERYKATARTAQIYRYALPKELTKDQNVDLIREFCQQRFISHGLVATYGIHWEEGNPHVHIQVSTRSILSDGSLSYVKTARELTSPSALRESRKQIADLTNIKLEQFGIEARVDHRSYAERGLDLLPSLRKGYTVHNLERDGISTQIGTRNARIFEENKDRIIIEPDIILKEIMSKKATFSEQDVIKLIHKRLGDDLSVLADHVFVDVMQKAKIIGHDLSEQPRYSTQEYIDKEVRVLDSLNHYREQKAVTRIDEDIVAAHIRTLEIREEAGGIALNDGQKDAIRSLCGDDRLHVMIGRAGTGKTTTLKEVVDLHKAAGYEVWGMAPSATAAEQLEVDTGNPAETLASYAYRWKYYHHATDELEKAESTEEIAEALEKVKRLKDVMPTDKTLILVDEAGMVGMGDWRKGIANGFEALVKTLDIGNCKIILVGDNHQFKPVDAADVFRKVVDDLRGTSSLCQLDDIMRQKVDWQREASQHLAELRTGTALEAYEQRGHIDQYSTNTQVYEQMAAQYLRKKLEQPDSTGTVIAATNAECNSLNQEIRSILKANNLLSQEDLLYHKGDHYALDDLIVFRSNDKNYGTEFETSHNSRFFVRNGTLATIQSIQPIQIEDNETGEITHTHEIIARVQGKAEEPIDVKFRPDCYDSFHHGYAGTGHRSQGGTFDWTLAKLSGIIDAYSLYVIMTRHRYDLNLYYSKQDFSDFNALVRSVGKVSYKDMVVDYTVIPAHREYWKNIQDYKQFGLELMGIRTLAGQTEKAQAGSIWEDYRRVEQERTSLAKIILEETREHRDFIRQAGLTIESLEIAAGIRKKPMSRQEVAAQMTVEQYAASALEARTLWSNIRKTHPGSRSKTHPDWQKFEAARNTRGELANHINMKPILHRPFLKDAIEQLDTIPGLPHQKLSWSLGTIRIQAEAYQSKLLQQALLKSTTDPVKTERLHNLIAYMDKRDIVASLWSEIRPKIKEYEGTLLKDSHSRAIDEFTQHRKERDALAAKIVDGWGEYQELAGQIHIKLDESKLLDQAVQARRDILLAAYHPDNEETERLAAAVDLKQMMASETNNSKKITVSQIYQNGYQPQDIVKDAREHQKLEYYKTLTTEADRQTFILLDEYDSHCRKANSIYSQCANEGKGNTEFRPWHSTHYPAYKAACEIRNDSALEVFDQRDHGQVLAMADKMGMRFQDVELKEIFMRCEQAQRTRHIDVYLKNETVHTRGQAAVDLRQMIAFERSEGENKISATARQAYHSGIDSKALQETAFAYGRLCALEKLSDPKEIALFHTLEAYEKASKIAGAAYKVCIDESKANTIGDKVVKPWETDAFVDYIAKVTVKDEQAYQLVKGSGVGIPVVEKIAHIMGVSSKTLDVDAHRHYLRERVQLFVDNDRSTGPLAAIELLNWLDFDRDTEHRHTFKVIRERDIWPEDIHDSLREFYDKKRALRQEARQEIKQQGRANQALETSAQAQSLPVSGSAEIGTADASLDVVESQPQYRTISYKRKQNADEVKQELLRRWPNLVLNLMGNPANPKSSVWEYGRMKATKVFMDHHERFGSFFDFSAGKGGDVFCLIQHAAGVSGFKDALGWAQDWLGGNQMVVEHKVIEKTDSKRSTWTPITPIPRNVPNPDVISDKWLNYQFKEGHSFVERYEYRNENNQLLGYVYRLEKFVDDKKDKKTPPLSWCRNEKGFEAWRWKGFETKNKTLYGIHKLLSNPDKPVLIVEGERKADIAQKMLPDYVVVGWGGGAGSVGNSNYTPLIGKQVVVWPDHDFDQGGQKAAAKLQTILNKHNQEQKKNGTVGIVNLPDYLPNKWDLADTLPEGWTAGTVKGMIQAATIEKPAMPEIIEVEKTIFKEVAFKEKKLSTQDNQILTYLRAEINIEKQPWLKPDQVDHYLKAAEENPVICLIRWQRVSGDTSFKLNPEQVSLTPGEQKAIQIQEKQILAYLRSEINAVKQPDFKPEQAEHYLNIAEKNPKAGLAQWQKFSGDTSFKPTVIELPLTPEQVAATKVQNQEILTYLTSEINIEKQPWLKPDQVDHYLKAAEENPKTCLTRWRKVSGDTSFYPKVPLCLMTVEQRQIQQNILSYMIIQLGRNSTVSLSQFEECQAIAQERPLQALLKWQEYARNYSYNPYKLTDQEKKIYSYMSAQLPKYKDRYKPKDYLSLQHLLMQKPTVAYQQFAIYTDDKMFDLKTGVSQLEIQAQDMMKQLRPEVSKDIYALWQKELIHSPEKIIAKCQTIIQSKDQEVQLKKDVDTFVVLSERSRALPWGNPELTVVDDKISKLVETHFHNPAFKEQVLATKNFEAMDKIRREIRIQEQALAYGNKSLER